MIYDREFIIYASNNKLDVSYNTGSKYYNSKATRIAYYLFKGEIGDKTRTP